MKTILLLDTSVGSLNQGDEIINLSIKNNWAELFDGNYIMRLATHTPMYSPIQSSIYKNKLSVFKNADYKFLCGTNALYTNMLRPLPTWNINCFNYRLAENTICLGTGIGINSNRINSYTKNLFKKVLSHDYIHSVRDEKTKQFLNNLGFDAENTGCPSLWGLTQNHCSSIPVSKGDKAVFTLTYYLSDCQNDSALVDILLKNYSEVYFWPQCIKDLDYFKSISQSNEVRIINPNLASYEKLLSQGDVDYVGNRLHGGIFALQQKCRTIIISIDYRAKEMNDNYSFPCIAREDINDSLDMMINSEWKTVITGLDFDLIDDWKRQFVLV